MPFLLGYVYNVADKGVNEWINIQSINFIL